MREIYLIRHGKTAGNLEKRYVGSTDEPLCEVGVCEIKERRNIFLRSFLSENERNAKSQMEAAYESDKLPEKVYVSPMLRCRQTAELLFPGVAQEVVADFREMDFGQFEYKNYEELADDVRYQEFIDSAGTQDFPGAEPQQLFKCRVQHAFRQCLEKEMDHFMHPGSDQREKPLVFVVHGGTIMAIMEKFARPHRGYFEWQVGVGCGYRCMLRCEGDGFYLDHEMEISRAMGTERSI